jgi:hypothetical protein
MNSLVATENKPYSLSPQSFDQAWTLAQMLANSEMVPKDYRGKSENCMIAMQWGDEIGLKPLQAIQNIAVINGRPSMWGDALLALVYGSPACELVNETDDGHTATCIVKRRGQPQQSRTFSMEDAKQAGLFEKTGPWTTNPKRMRQMRARAFALRDVFTDVLRGMAVAEEVIDIGEVDMGAAVVVEKQMPQAPKATAPAPSKPALDGEKFDSMRDKWAASPRSADELIQTLELKFVLTDTQKADIKALKMPQSSNDFTAAYEAAESATE